MPSGTISGAATGAATLGAATGVESSVITTHTVNIADTRLARSAVGHLFGSYRFAGETICGASPASRDRRRLTRRNQASSYAAPAGEQRHPGHGHPQRASPGPVSGRILS